MKLLQTTSRPAAVRSAGFTVAEAIVGMGIVGVLIISLYAGLTSGMGTIQLAREDMRATEILVRNMDQIRLFTWDQITNGTTIPTSFLAGFNPANPTPTNNMTSSHVGNGNAYGQQSIIPLVYSGTVTISAFPDATPTYNAD